ncbi:hypothetical protein [Ectopseudomonas oleovorans]|uniref:Uncharacterized protein n=1 Tax=Ectopseudomonas oleovorans TaxID=301 RepID=A0A3D9E739_ECTOL|nr:hypothetical protein [Pseudomonas oleovorans]REC98860.1 hypothetical protein DFO60_4919 [Pseudomonas oleovorans]
MCKTLELVSDQELANRLNALIATNVKAVMASAIIDPAVRSGIVKTLEARPEEFLTTEERVWLEWCRGFE